MVDKVNQYYFLLRDWKIMDTSFAAKFTDIELLTFIESIPINNGWGLIAELMKRYSQLKGL